jgi:hypothetical protein
VKSPILLYEDKPKYDRWLIYLIIAVPVFTLIAGLAVVKVDITETCTLLGTTVFISLLFWAIMPRSYQIYADRFTIQLGGPFVVNVSLTSIQKAGKASSYYALAYWGVRFATSTSNVVEIKRNRGMAIIISPSDVDSFLEHLDQAQKSLSSN